MDDAAINQAIIVFWGGVLGGLVLGGLAGWRKGFGWGIGIGCLTIGAAGLAGAVWLGWHRYQSLAGNALVEGVLVEWVTERSTDANRRTSIMHAPIVQFVARDGTSHRAKGLSRGEDDLVPGTRVPVRYRIDDPAQALIADFQNLWGGVWALVLFGAIPALMGAFFGATALAESRAARSATSRRTSARALPPSPRRQELAQKLTVAANLLFVSAFLFGFVGPESVAKALGLTFLTVAAACAIHVCACLLRGDEWQRPAILIIVGSAFALFGAGGYLLG